jgi:pimeloyl-ACP methyl ester carboxylesterase
MRGRRALAILLVPGALTVACGDALTEGSAAAPTSAVAGADGGTTSLEDAPAGGSSSDGERAGDATFVATSGDAAVPADDDASGDAAVVLEPPPTEPPPTEPPPEEPPPDPFPGAGPEPTATCAITKNGNGFFTRTSSQSSYVAYVPASYDGSAPVRAVVGLHGCGDSAMNFATWAIAPWESRATQDHIAISVGGKDGQCWTMGGDDAKVLAAVDDLATCFWIHQKKVVVAGYSSGGMLAYRVGLAHAERFAGILVEDSGLYGAGGAGVTPAMLLAGAAWKLNVAHLTHSGDLDYTLAKVTADWAKITAAGFPLVTTITAGTHDGTSADWSSWLLPQSAAFVAP